MKTLKRLLKYASPLHHYLPEYIIYTIIGIVFGLVNFSMLIPLLDVLFDKVKPDVLTRPEFTFSIQYFINLFKYHFNSYIVLHNDKFGALIFVGAFIAICTTIANVGRYMSARVIVRLRMVLLEKVRNAMYNKVTEQSLSFYHNRKKGEILTIFSSDVQEIESNVVNSIQVFLRDPFIIVAYFSALFYLSAKLTLFTIFFFPISGFLLSYISKKLKQKGFFSMALFGETIAISEESISGIRVIQSFSAVKFMQRKFASVNRHFIKVSKSIYNQREMASPISEIFGVIIVVILIVYGGSIVLSGDKVLTSAAFITYLVFYSQILQPAKNISTAITSLQKGLVSSERIFGLLDAEVNITEKPDAIAVKGFDKDVTYNNVTFAFEKDPYKPVLKNVQLQVKKGEMIALVGRSGAGKSTMADILPRFYDVDKGSVTIDGVDVKDIKLDDLRGLMGVVSQEAILFNDTVLNNIAFGQTNVDRDAVIQAAKIANAHEFIEGLENGYDTTIGDRGMKLSGGQRQRLTIARAVFKNPPIMILDEATSALDTESEKLVQESLDKLMQNRTTIVIAHRLSTIQHANKIVVMEKGEIVETGTHDELMAVEGIYRKLVEMQEFK